MEDQRGSYTCFEALFEDEKQWTQEQQNKIVSLIRNWKHLLTDDSRVLGEDKPYWFDKGKEPSHKTDLRNMWLKKGPSTCPKGYLPVNKGYCKSSDKMNRPVFVNPAVDPRKCATCNHWRRSCDAVGILMRLPPMERPKLGLMPEKSFYNANPKWLITDAPHPRRRYNSPISTPITNREQPAFERGGSIRGSDDLRQHLNQQAETEEAEISSSTKSQHLRMDVQIDSPSPVHRKRRQRSQSEQPDQAEYDTTRFVVSFQQLAKRTCYQELRSFKSETEEGIEMMETRVSRINDKMIALDTQLAEVLRIVGEQGRRSLGELEERQKALDTRLAEVLRVVGEQGRSLGELEERQKEQSERLDEGNRCDREQYMKSMAVVELVRDMARNMDRA